MPRRSLFRPFLGLFLGVVAAVVPRSDGAAQVGGDPTPYREAMERLVPLVGDWEGDGWVAPPGGRRAIRQYESVRFELGGTILVIEGTVRAREGEAVGGVIFSAFGVVSWSPDGGFRVRSYLWNGLYADRPMTMRDDGFTWEHPTAAGPIRYRLDWTGGVWHEAGWLVRADGAEVQTMDFTLHRVTSAK